MGTRVKAPGVRAASARPKRVEGLEAGIPPQGWAVGTKVAFEKRHIYQMEVQVAPPPADDAAGGGGGGDDGLPAWEAIVAHLLDGVDGSSDEHTLKLVMNCREVAASAAAGDAALAAAVDERALRRAAARKAGLVPW